MKTGNRIFLRNPFAILLFVVILISSALPVLSQSGESTLPDQVILEVTQIEMGVGGCNTMELYGRLYKDGRFEYEVTKELKPKTSSDYCQRVKKEIRLNEEEVANIVRLLGRPDFLNAKDYYPGKSLIDIVHILTVGYRHQGRTNRIKLVNYGYTVEHWKEAYPSSLKGLLDKVGALKAGKKFRHQS